MTILVAGATGFVGGEVALRLQQRKQQVRALARGGLSHPKAKPMQEAGIAVVNGDLTLPETLAAACQGIETVVTTVTSMPTGANDGLRRVDHEGTLALIAAAERAGVKKFVYTSYSGNIREDSPLETAKRACEDRLLAGPMLAVILRPSYFMEMWLSPVLGFDPGNGSARIYGSGEAKGNYISAFDVAEFAVLAAIKQPTSKNTILEMGGPDALSQLEAVRIFEHEFGRPMKLDSVPTTALEEQHRSSDPLQKTFAALMLGYAKGDVIEDATTLANQYGIMLRSVSDYARRVRQQMQSVA